MPLLWVSTAFLLGIVGAKYLSIGIVGWGVTAVAGGVLLFLQSRLPRCFQRGWLKRIPVSLGFLVISLCLGGMRYQLTQRPVQPDEIAWYNDQNAITVEGMVIKPPDQRETKTLLTLQAIRVYTLEADGLEPNEVKGNVVLHLPIGEKTWEYGEVLKVSGRLVTPPETEDFSYRAYLAQQGIYSVMYSPDVERIGENRGKLIPAVLYRIRLRAFNFIQAYFPQPEAGLLSGILLGIDGNLPEQMEQDFKDTGTSHILVISGFNIAIIAESLTFLFHKIKMRRWIAFCMNVFLILAYVMLVGGDAPVMRAAIMGIVALLGRYLGRRSSAINSLVFTAGLMCLGNPYILWSVSFQLSFTATFGMIFFGSKLTNWLTGWLDERLPAGAAKKISTPVGDYFLTTIAAQLTTLPVIAYHFQRIALNSTLANIFVLPIQPLVMLTGGIATILGVINPFIGGIAASIAWGPLAYTGKVVALLAQFWRGVLTTGEIPMWVVILYYGIILGLPILWQKYQVLRAHITWSTATVGLSLLSIVVWKAVIPLPDQYLHSIVLDVPDGPAYLVKAPGGGDILIGGSSSSVELNRALAEHMPSRNTHIEYLLITGVEAKQINGIEGILSRYTIENVLYPQNKLDTPSWEAFASTLEAQGAILNPIEAGQSLDLGMGATLTLLANPKRGTGLMLDWDAFQCLIPGGTDPAGYTLEPGITLTNPDILILNEADITDTRRMLWQEIQPGAILTPGTCPVDWGWNAPTCTGSDVNGWISIETDGVQMWLESEH